VIVAVHQPQYLPWLGYFDKVDRADLFVVLDTVQFKKNEFQNRNRIKTTAGWQWLTVPVHYRFPQTIREVTVNADVNWRHKHRQAIVTNYSKTPYFEASMPFFDGLYRRDWGRLSDLNVCTVLGLMERFGIATPVCNADAWDLSDDPTGRLVDICRKAGARTYLSGAGGRDYLDLAQFEAAGVEVVFQDYRHPEYPQQFGPFEPFMSAADLLFNCGPDSLQVIRSGRPG